MRQLAETQNQLRAFQVKIASLFPLLEKTPIATYTAKPIQSVLNPLEQTRFQKLILQRETVQIQQLQQKLLAPQTVTPTTTPTTKTIKEAPIVQKQEETEKTTNQTPANLAKIQLFIFIIFLNI